MFSLLLSSYFNRFKFLNFRYLFIKLLKKKIIFKNYYIFFLRKNILFFLNKNCQNIFFLFFFKNLICFLKGFKSVLEIKGRRLKFFINFQFFFLKMDTSKYLSLKIFKNIYLKKSKKTIKFFFFDVKVYQLLNQIQKLKIPNIYTKKGIFLTKT